MKKTKTNSTLLLAREIDIVIPVFNLRSRGYERLRWLLFSISIQKPGIIKNIFMVIGSDRAEFDKINAILSGFPVQLIHYPLREYSKPYLLNKGIFTSCLKTHSELIACIDADDLFHPNFFANALNFDDCLLLHKIHCIPPGVSLSERKVRNWEFPQYPPFPHGDMSCGAIQMAPKLWWESMGGYDERLSGMGCEDVDVMWRAERDNLPVIWMNESEILHQYHRPLPMKNFEKNRQIVDNDRSIIRNQKG